MTQKEIAEKFSLTQGLYSRYETEDLEPNSDFLKKFLKEYKVNLYWFYYGEGEMFITEEKENPKASEKIAELENEIESF